MTTDVERLVPEELRLDARGVTNYLVIRLRRHLEQYSQRRSAVIGLSGGVDSSVVACLAVRAVGAARVHLYYLPSDSTSTQDERDAHAVVELLKVPGENFQVVAIDSLAGEFTKKAGVGSRDRLVVGNIKARVRMILLHAYAQRARALVVGTGDKSELTIGYFTKFGDGGVDVLPLGDLFKTQVRQIAAYLGLPETVYTKPPSPGLWKDQSAEGELGIDYFLLDRILYRRFDLWKDEAEIARDLKISREQVDRIVGLVKKTQHKRYPPEIFRVSFRSHGSDWRYPREWR
ncbi:MAG: NAD+ synthase [Thaumarchaeota archaeon]|nr:NAD+ synthase [Nitrososphaerota archaeon]